MTLLTVTRPAHHCVRGCLIEEIQVREFINEKNTPCEVKLNMWLMISGGSWVWLQRLATIRSEIGDEDPGVHNPLTHHS